MISLKDRTFKVGLKIFLVMLFFIGLHFVAIEVVFKPLERAKKNADAVEKELADTEKLVKDNQGAREKTKEILARMEALRERSVSSKELPRIIQQLTKKSSELKMDIISIKPVDKVDFQEAKLPQGVSKAYIEIIVRAPFMTIGDYLKAIKEMPIAFTVESVNISKTAEGVELGKEKSANKKQEGEPQGELVATMMLSSYTIWQL